MSVKLCENCINDVKTPQEQPCLDCRKGSGWESKSVGCEFCNGDKTYSQNIGDDSYDIDFYKGKLSVTVQIVGKIVNGGSFSVYRDDAGFLINYCPMCGKKLVKE